MGGGLATLPFLYNIADTTGWYTHADVANMIAVSESTPGALGINMATYAGYLTAGVPGGVVATLGLISPSIVIILVIARMLKRFQNSPLVQRGFTGCARLHRAGGRGGNERVQGDHAGPARLRGPAQPGGSVCMEGAGIGGIFVLGPAQIQKIHPIAFIAFAGLVGAVFSF